MNIKNLKIVFLTVTAVNARFDQEVYRTYELRCSLAQEQTIDRLPYTDLLHPFDDASVEFYAASFTKLLEHDSKSGLLTQDGQKNFQLLLKALKSGKQSDFNAIKRSPHTELYWANPQAAFSYGLLGPAVPTVPLSPPPLLSSADAAADIIELYCMLLCRNFVFADYIHDNNKKNETMRLVTRILNDLGSAYHGPKKNNRVESALLFRGNSAGDLIGPYISQFLLQPLKPLFSSNVDAHLLSPQLFTLQRQLPIIKQREFGVSWHDFVKIQNGEVPKPFLQFDCEEKNRRYLLCGRDLGFFVYTDGVYDAYLLAVQCLACNDLPFSSVLPYQKNKINNEGAGITFGFSDIYSLVSQVSIEASRICWFHKWRMYRRLRPEAMGGLVHQAKISGNNIFGLHSSIFSLHDGIDLLALVLQHNQRQADKKIDPQQLLTVEDASTYLLAQMYPEGSPRHPSYPSAHATIAGACTTVIKAFVDDTQLLKSKMKLVDVDPANPNSLLAYTSPESDYMTVGSELDKLASNMAYGRSWAGVHYRSDNEAGLHLGEEIALNFLQAHSALYNEKEFKGFELTRRNGQRIRITAQKIYSVSKK